MTLRRYDVALYDAQRRKWVDLDVSGSICLPGGAKRHHVEHALALVQVYAPRGADTLTWSWYGGTVRDAQGTPLVRLQLHTSPSVAARRAHYEYLSGGRS